MSEGSTGGWGAGTEPTGDDGLTFLNKSLIVSRLFCAFCNFGFPLLR